MENIYNPSKASDYKRFYTVSESDKKNIKNLFQEIIVNLDKTETLNLLLLGVGTGRLELPLIETIVENFSQNLKEINITAIDASKQMLNEFNKDYSKLQSHGVKLNLKALQENIKDANIFTDTQYDIITAFFVIHMLDQWVPVLKDIIKSLKPGGFFLSAEEIGMAKIIDGMWPDNEIWRKLLDDKDEDFIYIWEEFFKQRTDKGKPWFQPITASYYLLLYSILERLDFKKLVDTEIVFTSQLAPFQKDNFLRWFTETALFHPIGKFLTPTEKKSIFSDINSVLQKSKNEFERNGKEGHRFTIFSKPTITLHKGDIQDATSYSLKVFLNDNINLTFIDRNFSLKDLFEEVDLPEFESEKYRKAISNRLFILGITLYNCFHEKVHIDYIIWKPDYYYQEKSRYKHNLPAFIHMGSKERLHYYLATYSFYFLARELLVTDKTFIDFIFHRFKHFTNIIIKRDKKLDITIEKHFDKTFRLIITLPEFDPIEPQRIMKVINQVYEKIKKQPQFEYGKILYAFDDIIGLAGSLFDDSEKDEIKNAICQLYNSFKNKYVDSFKDKFIEEKRKIFGIDKFNEEDAEIDLLLKSLLCFNFIGIGNPETRWEKIRFYLGFIFSKEQNFEGFNILANIDFYGDDIIDNVVNIPSKIWSSKDGLYGSLQLIKEHVFTHALHSAISAIMSRNMSHNIGSHVIARAINKNYNGEDGKAYKDFLLYLQERMDFLALVSTTEAIWGVKYNLRKLLDNFKDQKILLDNIVESEDKNMKVKVEYPPKLPDILVPHGEAGKHAVYTILENFIRNSAKHQWMRLENKPNSLQINIECDENKSYPLMYRLTISSNLAVCNSNLIKNLNKRLSDNIIDKVGKLIQDNRGLKEQRISACFLRLLPVNKIEEYTPDRMYKNIPREHAKKEPPLVTAVCIKNNEIEPIDESICKTQKCNFGIVLYLLKPMELLWIKEHDMSPEDIDELKSRGILVYRSIEEAEKDFSRTFPAKMVLFSKNAVDADWLRNKDNLRRLPYRILTEGVSLKENNPWFVQISSKKVPSFDKKNQENYTNQLLEFLWGEWVKNFYKADEDSGKKVAVIHCAHKDSLKYPFVFSKDFETQYKYILSHDIRNNRPEGIKFYIPYSGTDDLGRIISQIGKRGYRRWEITEMVYSRILIIDERIHDSRDIRKGDERIEEIWKRQGIDIIEHTQIMERPEIILEKLDNKGAGYHFLIIHQGIIDKIIERHGKSKFDSVWTNIEQKVPFPVVSSGRGKPEAVREGKGRWLQFSDLEQHILQCADNPDAKYHLIQVLFALREEKRGEW